MAHLRLVHSISPRITAQQQLEWFLLESDLIYSSGSNWPDLLSLSTGASVSDAAPPPPVTDYELGWAVHAASGGSIARSRHLESVWRSLPLDTRVVLRAWLACPVAVPRAARKALGEYAGVAMAMGLESDRAARRTAKQAVDAALSAWAKALAIAKQD